MYFCCVGAAVFFRWGLKRGVSSNCCVRCFHYLLEGKNATEGETVDTWQRRVGKSEYNREEGLVKPLEQQVGSDILLENLKRLFPYSLEHVETRLCVLLAAAAAASCTDTAGGEPSCWRKSSREEVCDG